MICPNCKIKLKEELKYCPRCGIIFKSDDVEKYSKDFESDLLNMYLYKNIRNDGIPSFKYLLFNYHYAIYKKMYKTAIYLIISTIFFISIIINIDFFLLFSIRYYPIGMIAVVIFIFLAIKLFLLKLKNTIVKECRGKLNKITKNKNYDNETIISKIELDNKNNTIGVIISIFITIIIIICLYFFS